MLSVDPRVVKAIGIVIAAGLAIAAAFGITIDIPVINPVFPVS